ncbi:MAG TPA: YigZ family protein [Ruminococcaceae bacterium]|nr:YigZ family protein [Oscillospiraceae bacterium]
METYKTVRARARAEFTEKRSRFIGHICPSGKEEDALAFIGEIRSEHPAAAHNVYAYILRENQIRRYSDNGEPKGTAGVPCLEVLSKSGLTDCTAVVTRYFGGVLLGAGGLVRAYSHAVKIALDEAGIVTMGRCLLLTLRCGYNQFEKIRDIICDFSGTELKTDYAADIQMDFQLEKPRLEEFNVRLSEYSLGSVNAEVTGECFAPIS